MFPRSTSKSKHRGPNYEATTSPVSNVHVRSDDGRHGYAVGKPGARSFIFDIGDGQLKIYLLAMVFNDFVVEGHTFHQASAMLRGPFMATAAAGNPNKFVIPAGTATFELAAVENVGDTSGYGLSATNSTDLVISGIDTALGPYLSGTLSGTLEGHQVDATLNVLFQHDSAVTRRGQVWTIDSTDGNRRRNGATAADGISARALPRHRAGQRAQAICRDEWDRRRFLERLGHVAGTWVHAAAG